jgi:hypothetical protein
MSALEPRRANAWAQAPVTAPALRSIFASKSRLEKRVFGGSPVQLHRRLILKGIRVITEIVTFSIPVGMSRERIVSLFEESAEMWRAHPKLHRKNYLYDPATGIAGGVYTWDTIADAKEAHGDAFLARVAETFGSEPSFQYFETPIVVQNR